MSARPFSIFFGNGNFVRFEYLLKKRIMSFPALLFSLCLVTNNIRSLYASLGNSEQASDSGFSNPSKFQALRMILIYLQSHLQGSLLIFRILNYFANFRCFAYFLYCQMTYFVLHSHLPPKVIQLVHSK